MLIIKGINIDQTIVAGKCGQSCQELRMFKELLNRSLQYYSLGYYVTTVDIE